MLDGCSHVVGARHIAFCEQGPPAQSADFVDDDLTALALVLLLLDPDDLVAPRGKDYLVVEILCFTGRSREARRALIAAFYDDVAPTLGLSADDLEVIIIESPPENWGIRGVSGDELSLGYRVDV